MLSFKIIIIPVFGTLLFNNSKIVQELLTFLSTIYLNSKKYNIKKIISTIYWENHSIIALILLIRIKHKNIR